jgi:hypothetical protein
MNKNDVLDSLRSAKDDLEAAIAAKNDYSLWHQAGPAAAAAIGGAITLLSEGESNNAEGGADAAGV